MTTTRRTLTGAALAFCAAILLASPTRPLLAEDVTFQFTTTIDASSVGGPVNAPLVATYTFDSQLANGTGPFGIDSYGPLRMWLQVGDQSVTASGNPGSGILVGNNWGNGTTDGDGYDVRFENFGDVSGQLFGLDVLFFRFLLVDSDGTMLTSSDLPLSPAFASGTEFIQIDMFLFDPTTGEGIYLSYEFPDTPPEDKTPFSLTMVDDPISLISDLSLSVQALVDGGVSLPADGKSLQATLDAVFKANDAPAAIGSLNGFIGQVQAYINNGKLTPVQGQSLIDAAWLIIFVLGS